MAGYCGYSMSNNAVDAYENGGKPSSKWTKSDILKGNVIMGQKVIIEYMDGHKEESECKWVLNRGGRLVEDKDEDDDKR